MAFVSACVRETHWFLSMLFVLPEEQAGGIGRLLLERVLPSPDSGMTLATATDSAQPISNALYSRVRDDPADAVVEPVGRAAATRDSAGPA